MKPTWHDGNSCSYEPGQCAWRGCGDQAQEAGVQSRSRCQSFRQFRQIFRKPRPVVRFHWPSFRSQSGELFSPGMRPAAACCPIEPKVGMRKQFLSAVWCVNNCAQISPAVTCCRVEPKAGMTMYIFQCCLMHLRLTNSFFAISAMFYM